MTDITTSTGVDSFMQEDGLRRSLQFLFDVPSNGTISQELIIPYGMTIVGWKLKSVGITGTIELDLWKDASTTPDSGDSIVASAPPTTSSAFASSTTLTGWTTSLSANDLMICEVVDNGGASQIILSVQTVDT